MFFQMAQRQHSCLSVVKWPLSACCGGVVRVFVPLNVCLSDSDRLLSIGKYE